MTDETLVGRIQGTIKSTGLDDNFPVHNPTTLKDPFTYDEYNGISALQNIDEILDRVTVNPRYDGLDWFKSETSEKIKRTPKEAAYDNASDLLQKCMWPNTRTVTTAEAAMELIDEHSLTGFYHICHGLVYFPSLLQRFLDVHRRQEEPVADDDLASMISRCIEYRADDVLRSRVEDSLGHLLSFKEHIMGSKILEIKLLPGKYTIDDELYRSAISCGVRDSYYDAVISCVKLPYEHADVVASEKAGRYCGFRDAYHSLLYGDREHLQALIVRWDLWGDDCTGDAAREFFKLDSCCPLAPVITCINQKCTSL